MEITVRNISGFNEVKIATRKRLILTELLDEGESLTLSCQLISAAKDLLPVDFDVEMKALALIRKGLEAY